MSDFSPASSAENANVILSAGLGSGAAGLETARKHYVAYGCPALTAATLMRIACAAGDASVASEPLLEDCLSLLREIKRAQDSRGGDSARISGPLPTDDVLDHADMSWSNAAGRHPVLQLIFECAAKGAFSLAMGSAATTEGFPSRPLTALAEALNAVMSPETRLPLESIPNNDLLRLITLSAAASQHQLLMDYWLTQADGPTHTPDNIIKWLIDRREPGVGPMRLLDIDDDEDRYNEVLGSGRTNYLRSRVIHASMEATIGLGASSVEPGASGEQVKRPPASRRSRAV